MKSLKPTLEKLHQQLAATEELDPELVEILGALDQDIHKLLEQDGDSQEAGAALATQADSLAARFAANHPQIDSMLREIAAVLGRAGI